MRQPGWTGPAQNAASGNRSPGSRPVYRDHVIVSGRKIGHCGVYEDRSSKRSITCCKNPPSAASNSTILVASKFNGDMNELEKTYIPHLCPQFERGCTLQSRVTSELVQRIGQCTSPMTVPWSSRSIDRIARQPGSSVPVEIAS